MDNKTGNNDVTKSEAYQIVKADDASMFASDEELLAYHHFFVDGMQHAEQQCAALKEEVEKLKGEVDDLIEQKVYYADLSHKTKEENERLKTALGNLIASYEQYGEIPSGVMTEAQKALNPKDTNELA